MQDDNKNLVLTVDRYTIVVLRDASGQDIARFSMTNNEANPNRVRMLVNAPQSINVRRERTY